MDDRARGGPRAAELRHHTQRRPAFALLLIPFLPFIPARAGDFEPTMGWVVAGTIPRIEAGDKLRQRCKTHGAEVVVFADTVERDGEESAFMFVIDNSSSGLLVRNGETRVELRRRPDGLGLSSVSTTMKFKEAADRVTAAVATFGGKVDCRVWLNDRALSWERTRRAQRVREVAFEGTAVQTPAGDAGVRLTHERHSNGYLWSILFIDAGSASVAGPNGESYVAAGPSPRVGWYGPTNGRWTYAVDAGVGVLSEIDLYILDPPI